MLKKFSKTMLAFLLCLGLLTVSLSPVFADTIEGINENVETMAAASNYQLVDGGSCTQTIPAQSLGIFTVTVNDRDTRHIVVSGSAEVKTTIIPNSSSGLSNFISFDSGDYRYVNMIDWHFIPGVQYTVLVQPRTTADVTVSMSKTTSSFTWVNCNSAFPITEKNILMSGENEFYGFAFKEKGLYKITISTASKLDMQFVDSDAQPEHFYGTVYSGSPRIISFDVEKDTQGAQNIYGLSLTNIDAPGQGGVYTITVERF